MLSGLNGENVSQQNELKLSVVSLKEVQDSLKSKIVDSPEKVKNYKEKMKSTVQKLRNSLVSSLCGVLLSELLISIRIFLLDLCGIEGKEIHLQDSC